MTSIVEVVYNDYDNAATILVKRDGLAYDMSNATRFVLVVGTVTVDTNSSPTAITTTSTTGELEFNLGGESLPLGKTPAYLIVYDSLHANGQVLFHASSKELIFHVKDTPE